MEENKMELANDEIFYLRGLIDQQLEDCKFTLTGKEFEFRFNLRQKIMTQVTK